MEMDEGIRLSLEELTKQEAKFLAWKKNTLRSCIGFIKTMAKDIWCTPPLEEVDTYLTYRKLNGIELYATDSERDQLGLKVVLVPNSRLEPGEQDIVYDITVKEGELRIMVNTLFRDGHMGGRWAIKFDTLVEKCDDDKIIEIIHLIEKPLQQIWLKCDNHSKYSQFPSNGGI